MGKEKSRSRRPDAGEQEILDGLVLRLVTPEEAEKFNGLVAERHYLKSSVLVGEHIPGTSQRRQSPPSIRPRHLQDANRMEKLEKISPMEPLGAGFCACARGRFRGIMRGL